MKRRFLASIVLALCVALPVSICAREAREQQVSPEEAAKMMAAPDSGVVVIDVRTPAEYADGHIANALNLDFFGSRFEYEIQKLPEDGILLLYCRTGVRSARAAELIAEQGGRKTLDLAGGIEAWRKAGLPIQKEKK